MGKKQCYSPTPTAATHAPEFPNLLAESENQQNSLLHHHESCTCVTCRLSKRRCNKSSHQGGCQCGYPSPLCYFKSARCKCSICEQCLRSICRRLREISAAQKKEAHTCGMEGKFEELKNLELHNLRITTIGDAGGKYHESCVHAGRRES